MERAWLNANKILVSHQSDTGLMERDMSGNHTGSRLHLRPL